MTPRLRQLDGRAERVKRPLFNIINVKLLSD